MHAYLGFSEYAVWFTVILLQAALVPILFQSGNHREYPAFTAYASFCLVRSVILLAVSSSSLNYFHVYWAGQFCEVLLALLVIRELFAKVMKPYGWIPPGVVPSLVLAGVGILAATTLLALSMPMGEHYPVMAFLRSFERVGGLLLFGGFASVALFSSMTHNPWPRTSFGIEAGFLFYLTLHAIAETMAHGAINPRPVRLVGRLAFAVALTIWLAHLWKPEKVTRRLPENIMDISRLRNKLSEQTRVLRG
ncbi:MAG TPA: hypothetical protein VNK82_00145 [Terriglobales bacterium]|nr:hypothetical protein [Terriglobales bacterium]